MKLFRSFALLVLLASPAFADELQPLVINDFSPGLQTTRDPTQIDNGAAQDLQNVDVWNGRITKRRGSVLQNSTVLGSYSSQPVRFIHEFPDTNGNFWMISASSATIFKSSDGGATNSVLTSTHGFTTNSQYNAVNAFGKVRLTDGTTNWITFDGTSVAVSTLSIKGKLAEFFAERVWTADVAGNRSTLYASANGDPEDWVDDENTDDDAWSTPIRQNDGYPIRAIKQFRNGLAVLKDYSLDFITTNPDGNTFTRTPISNTIGTQHPRSLQVVDNELIFLGPDAFYAWDGATLKRISDFIDPTVNSINQLNSFSRSYTETSQSAFQAGTNSQTSPSITAGSVLLSTATDTDTTGSDFSGGSTSNTSIINNRVYLSTSNTNVGNNSFETAGSGGAADAANWTEGGTAERVGAEFGASPQDGSWMMEVYEGSDLPSTSQVIIQNAAGATLATNSVGLPSSVDTWEQKTISLASFAGAWIKVKFNFLTSSGGSATSDTFLCSGGNLTFYYRYCEDCNGHTDYVWVDLVAGGRSTIYSGTFTSASFDTALTSAVWQTSTANYATNNHSVSFQTQSSSDGTNWQTATSWTPGSAPSSDFRRYLRYVVTLSTGGTTNGVALPYVDDVTLNARAVTGRYLSAAINTGSGSSYGLMNGSIDISSGGTIGFEIYTDSNTSITPTDRTTFISSQTITSGSIPTVSITTYTFIGSSFTVTAAGQAPVLQEISLEWNEGTAGFPIASTAFESDYLVAVSTESTTANDTIFVYDRNGNWTKYSNLPAYSMCLYRQRPYYGSNVQGSIFRFQATGILNDNGSAINSYWVSKEFDFGYPLTDKTMERYYVTAQYEAGSDAVFQYGVNRGSLKSETLDLDSVTGAFRKHFIPTLLTYDKGFTHRFVFSDSDVDDTFNILSVSLKARLETAP